MRCRRSICVGTRLHTSVSTGLLAQSPTKSCGMRLYFFPALLMGIVIGLTFFMRPVINPAHTILMRPDAIRAHRFETRPEAVDIRAHRFETRPEAVSFQNDTQDNQAEPAVDCIAFGDQTAYCTYIKSLCMSDGRLHILQDLKTLPTFTKQDAGLTPPPHHPAYFDDDDFLSGPAMWKPGVLPFRSFIPWPVSVVDYSSFLRDTSVKWKSGISLVAAFDADNYNIYHFVNTMFVSFLARVWWIEKLPQQDLDPASGLERLYEGRGYDFAYMFRPPPTDWQQNYADIAVGLKDVHTQYFYGADLSSELKTTTCFERAVIPGASLYLHDSIANSQLIREITSRLKNIPIRKATSKRDFTITWFVRDDKRSITNMDDIAKSINGVVEDYNQKKGAKVKFERVHWDGATTFEEQVKQMAKTRLFITTHGSVLNHAMFMDTGGVVVEVNGYQFRYTLDDRIVHNFGHTYIRYIARLEECQYGNNPLGFDPMPDVTSGDCNSNPDCVAIRRDANIKLNWERFSEVFECAFDDALHS